MKEDFRLRASDFWAAHETARAAAKLKSEVLSQKSSISGGELYRVKTTLKRFAQEDAKTKAYAYEVSEIEVLAGKPGHQLIPGTSNTSISGSILLQGVRNHNGNLILEDVGER